MWIGDCYLATMSLEERGDKHAYDQEQNATFWGVMHAQIFEDKAVDMKQVCIGHISEFKA